MTISFNCSRNYVKVLRQLSCQQIVLLLIASLNIFVASEVTTIHDQQNEYAQNEAGQDRQAAIHEDRHPAVLHGSQLQDHRTLYNRIERFPNKLFGCSTHHLYPHSYGIMLATDVFPEMDPTINELSTNRDLIQSNATENDILVFFMHSCPNLDPLRFPGKTIVVSGESKLGVPCAPSLEEWDKRCEPEMPSGPKIYLVGPHNNAKHSVKVHWGILLLNARMRPLEKSISTSEFHYLFHHELKPKNNGKYFLIYAVSHCVPFRDDAFDQLAAIGPEVHYTGLCKGTDHEGTNKQPSPYVAINRKVGIHLNKELFKNYRFSLVMENHPLEGASLSEKILNAYLGGTIPVYCGPWDIMEIFNPKSFVWYDPHYPEQALHSIAQLEANPELYRAKLNEPILKDGHHSIEKYFSLRDDVGRGLLKHRIRSMMGFDDVMYHLSLLNEERILLQKSLPKK